MLEQLSDLLECPICLEQMNSNIRQCTIGHSFCEDCSKRITRCPVCKKPIHESARNYQLEKIIANLKDIELAKVVPCKYKKKGCKLRVKKSELDNHVTECTHREFECEGHKFAKWDCAWKGDHGSIFEHFKTVHNEHTWMQYQTSAHLKIDFSKSYSDIQIISLQGRDLFWYKYKVDIEKEKVYWIFQYIGPRHEAKQFCYEFTAIHNPITMMKVRDLCESDAKDAGDIIEEEGCVCVPFKVIKRFLNEDNEIAFTFKIGRETDFDCKNQTSTSNKEDLKQSTPPLAYLQGQQIQYDPNKQTLPSHLPPNNMPVGPNNSNFRFYPLSGYAGYGYGPYGNFPGMNNPTQYAFPRGPPF